MKRLAYEDCEVGMRFTLKDRHEYSGTITSTEPPNLLITWDPHINNGAVNAYPGKLFCRVNKLMVEEYAYEDEEVL